MGQPVVLVTGASNGIGRTIACLLSQNGYRVFGTSRRTEDAQAVPGVRLLTLDVHSSASIRACVQQVLDEAGRIDVLVNNAGSIGPAAASEETSIEQVRSLFETNFFGVVQMVNEILPIMRRQGCGTIINMSSAVGLVGVPPFFSFYSASKHALEGYTEGLRHEVRPFDIRVALIEPGYTHTEIGETFLPPQRPLPAYEPARRRVTRLNRAGLRYGSSAPSVAQSVLQILRHPDPPLRTPTGADSRSILLAKRFLPSILFERLIDWMFLRWRPQENSEQIPSLAELGVRRFLFHAPTLVRVLKAGFTTAGVGLLAAIVLLLRKRHPRQQS